MLTPRRTARAPGLERETVELAAGWCLALAGIRRRALRVLICIGTARRLGIHLLPRNTNSAHRNAKWCTLMSRFF